MHQLTQNGVPIGAKALSELNDKFGGVNIKRIRFSTGQNSIYFRLKKSDWSKGYALIFGLENIYGYVLELVTAFVDGNENKIK